MQKSPQSADRLQICADRLFLRLSEILGGRIWEGARQICRRSSYALRDPEQFTMGAEQSTPRETTTETATMQNIVPAPAAARVGKTELNPKTKE